MQISEMRIKGFRNFKDAIINFNEKSLIIGPNDIGKSNLLYALRILLDKSLSEADIEPKDSDFYAYEDINEIFILVKFINAKEDCILAKFKENISDDGVLYLGFQASKDKRSGKKSYSFLCGRNIESLKTIESRFYLKVLNLKYIGSNRDLFSYIKKERKNLIMEAKEKRDDDSVVNDNKVLSKIEKSLDIINQRVTKLTYISQSTQEINNELSQLSFHNENQNIIFDVGTSDSSQFVDELELVSQVNGKSLLIGGDGRNNQIFLALWAARNDLKGDSLLEVNIYCIEEPECHLHPHQQRKLANYIANILKGQVIITTHSPQIACEFSPNSIIRLFDSEPGTSAACDGCSDDIDDAFIKFGHRLNIIPAEAFFSKVVLLVEGTSELLFYKALAPEIGVDLDRLNISVLSVEGVGFNNYINLFSSLNIDFVIRTDNDIFKIPNKDEFRYAGLQRCIDIYKKYYTKDKDIDKLLESENLLQGFKSIEPPKESRVIASKIIDILKEYNIFLANKDLENDLFNSELKEKIKEFYHNSDEESVTTEMQKQKASFMFSFLSKYSSDLNCLKDSELSLPILRCKELVEGENDDTNS